jgi:hypothetical protein
MGKEGRQIASGDMVALSRQHVPGLLAAAETSVPGPAESYDQPPLTPGSDWSFSPLTSAKEASSAFSLDVQPEALLFSGCNSVQTGTSFCTPEQQQQSAQNSGANVEVSLGPATGPAAAEGKQPFQEQPCFSWEEPCGLNDVGPKASPIRWRCNQLSTMDLGHELLGELGTEACLQTHQPEHLAVTPPCATEGTCNDGIHSSSKRVAEGGQRSSSARGNLKKLCRGDGGPLGDTEGVDVLASCSITTEAKGLLEPELGGDQLLILLQQERQRRAELEEKLHKQEQTSSV